MNEFDWEKFKEYVNTYPDGHLDTSIIIKDMVYGLGICISNEYEYSSGFKRFLDSELIPRLKDKNIRHAIK